MMFIVRRDRHLVELREAASEVPLLLLGLRQSRAMQSTAAAVQTGLLLLPLSPASLLFVPLIYQGLGSIMLQPTYEPQVTKRSMNVCETEVLT